MSRIIMLLFLCQLTFCVNAESDKGNILTEYSYQDKASRNVTYYLSRSNKKNAPLLLMIQGSGCSRVINKTSSGTFATIFNLYPIAKKGEFSVLAVEKPFSGPKLNSSGINVEGECSANFHQDFTVESWVDTLNTSIAKAILKLGYEPKQILVFGHSEGAGIASKLAVTNPLVTHVISSGGSGTTQMYDFVTFAYDRCFNRTKCIDEIYATLEDIKSAPNSAIRFAWNHPYKRWSSFFRLDPAENLLQSNAKVYLVFGTNDAATPALSQEIIAAKLLTSGKDITVRRIPDAGHSLQQGNSIDELEREHRLALDWFWGSIKHRGGKE